MSELREKLEAWASVANNRAFAFSDAEFGALAMLDLVWPVIEAAERRYSPAVDRDCATCDLGHEAPCTCWDYMSACQDVREALATLEQALKERE
jgi:hypothetical protein